MGVSLIAEPALSAVPLFQAPSGWQFDLPSLIVGLLLGAGLTYLVYRLRPRLLQFREESLNRVQETQAWVRAGVEKRFQAETAAYVRDYHLGGRRAALAAIFVEPRLLAEPPPVDPDQPPPEGIANLTTLWPEAAALVATVPPPTMSVRHLLLKGRRVILSAPGGAGKTTLLAICAHRCAHATDDSPYDFLLPVLPVLVHLAELGIASPETADTEGEGEPLTPLAQALQARSGPLTAPGIGNLLRQKMEGGQALLLLDGWDELPADRRPAVAAWLDQLLARYPQIQVIAATGPRGYGPLQALHFTVSGLLPWRPYQARVAGERWATVFEQPEAPAPARYWKPGRFPLATTISLWLWLEQRTAGPEQLPALLAETLSLFLPEPESGQDEEGALPAAARALWQQLAYRLLAEERLSLSRAEVNGEAEAVLATVGRAEQLREPLRSSVAESDLFRQWPHKQVSLLSPVWRDFLAAGHLAQMENGWELVQNHLDDRAWAEAIRFYVARVGAGQLAPRLLNGKRTDLWRDDLFHLARWLPESEEGAEWRRQTLIKLGQLIINPDVPAVIRQRAVALLARTGEGGVMALLRQLLQRAEAELRQAAISALAVFDPEQSVPMLERMLKDQEQAVRVTAVHALGWQNSELAEKPLLTALISRDEALRTAAAHSLALAGDEGWEILREAAADEDLSVRRAAAQGLALLDEPWAGELLQRMEREDGEWAVRSAATVALETMAERQREQPWTPSAAGELEWLVTWAAKRNEAVPGGDAALPTLLRVLATGEQAEYRVAAARSLRRVYLPPAEWAAVHSALRESAAEDPEWRVRQAAFATLAALARAET